MFVDPLTQQELGKALNTLNNETEDTLRLVFNTFNSHSNINGVIAKIAILDRLYSTNLKLLGIDIVDFAKKISNIKNIDYRLSVGDVSLVEEIVKVSNGKKPFVFATKYCCLHNYLIYKKDDYSIVDSHVKKELPKYANAVQIGGNKITESYLNKLQQNNNYQGIHNIIGDVLNKNNVSGRRAFDRLMWL